MYAVDRKHKEIISDDTGFQHHGIKGQRWGVITRNVGVNYIPIGQRNSMLKNARTHNLDSWGSSPDKNVLYVTGYSGSGKSSLAVAMASKKDSVIHLDSYFERNTTPNNKRFNQYLEKNFPEYRMISVGFRKQISLNEFGRLLGRFENEIENFGKSEFNNGRRVICEGVQLLDETIQTDKSYFKDKPMIIMKTNALVSAYRSANRDDIKIDLNLIKQDIPHYWQSHKEINRIRKAIE